MLPPKAKNQDLRNYSVIPIQAAMDKRLHGTAALSLLVVICTYTDQLGVTWVSQDRLAVDLGVSRTAIAKQMRRLRDLGYIVYAKKRSKYQKTTSVRVVFPTAPEDEQEAKANLTAASQIALEETRQAAAQEQKQQFIESRKNLKKPVDNSGTCDFQRSHQPVTSRGHTERDNRTYNNNIYNDEARQFSALFLKICNEYGTPRNVNDRDISVIARWIREGLTMQTWSEILTNHATYCYKNRRDLARGIGYFQVPVSKALGRSSSSQVNQTIQGIVRNTRS
jgi:biotin operon repressor